MNSAGTVLQGYNNLSQYRKDTWSTLEEAAERLAVAAAADRPVDAHADRVSGLLERLNPIERYWAFPGPQAFQAGRRLFTAGKYTRFARAVASVSRALASDSFRNGIPWSVAAAITDTMDQSGSTTGTSTPQRPYFEVLVVEDMTEAQERALRQELRAWRRPDDEFIYEIVVVPSFEDAVIAARINFSLQACVIKRRFAQHSGRDMSAVAHFVDDRSPNDLMEHSVEERADLLGKALVGIRPELDLYLMTEITLEDVAGWLSHDFRRIFHSREGTLELHLSLLGGIEERYRSPFFNALQKYSHRPTGVFHALPISQGKSIVNSHWIKDMIDFYGLDIFLAETSATCGGLDSLLEPTGPLREAQDLAARTFGSRQTFFATNGTSTANKIVCQALVQPGDIVLVDRNCHQSHHYGLMLSGAHVIYLDAYPLNEYSMYGAVPLRSIKAQLLELRRAGKLDRVKMLMLTNCTFDGMVYDAERVMQECLAIKPDLVFLWDEAWFAFARFHPVYRPRTGMHSAGSLLGKLRDPQYRKVFAAWNEQIKDATDAELLDTRLIPDPARARVRVYATQSTHKTLTSLRQGSMIHVFDQDFGQKVEENFHEAYMAHTSTSPNYQILASLDLGRRQAALEGFELVQKQVEYAMRLRDAVDNHPLLRKYMRCLTTADLIPAEFRPSGIGQPLRSGLKNMQLAWRSDEFALDPCRVTISIGATGIDGDTFKREYLMDRHGVQINKTSRNSVLFMTNIGTTRSSVAYLIEVLVKIARELDEKVTDMSLAERAAHEHAVRRLTSSSAPLPDFSSFHDAFRPSPADDPGPGPATPEGDVRRAFFLSYDDSLCEYLMPELIQEKLDRGVDVVSATYVTPYPPGFPVLVPGQKFSRQILDYMNSLDTSEVHGLRADRGYRVYIDKALEIAREARDGASSRKVTNDGVPDYSASDFQDS
ncbi:aminotransferase class I/II-fold pyridoxal phosphate-dependent enzyme [Nakamurella multipartita]|nr:aminotransferase class I/II-fold pyridoxal phosphate-dependent enzyme [Nakamurella multipartita]HOZ57138.1 beta-eliminating lyase-related protein [Nakamurella multipartita]